MNQYAVSSPSEAVVAAYARWKDVAETPERTLLHDGWTLPSLRFTHLYEAQAASLDLAMVSGSLQPLQPHEVLISEYASALDELCR